MFNPLAFLGLTVLSATAGGKKRGKRKQAQSSAEKPKQQDAAAQRRRVMEIQAGISFKKSESRRVVPPFIGGRRVVPQKAPVQPEGMPPLVQHDASSDTLSISRNGRLGFLGARWWALHGRPMLAQIRQQSPSMSSDDALQVMLRQALPAVDWDAEELPRGAQMISRRLQRFVESSYLGMLTRDDSVQAAVDEDIEAPSPDGTVVQSIPTELAAQIADQLPNEDKPRIEVVSPFHRGRRGTRGGSGAKKPDISVVESPEETENYDEPQGNGGGADEVAPSADTGQESAG